MSPLQETITERRRETRRRIYRYLYEAGQPRAQQDIARDLELSLPTVHQNLAELLEAGLLRYDTAQRSTGGRRPMTLTVNAAARFAVGISITRTRLRLVALDLQAGEQAYRRTQHLHVNEEENLGRLLQGELEQFLQENGLERERLLGVGIAVPGVLEPGHPNVVLSPTLHLHPGALATIAEELDVPFFIENDANCGGYAESFARPGNGNAAYLSLETGVGGAVLLKSGAYAGDNLRSGEFGHMCVQPGGRLCQCGRRGCLEAYCTAKRISEDLGVTLEEFFSELEAGNEGYAKIWDDLLRHLAVGINNIRMALDCEVILGGYLIPHLAPYLPKLRSYAAAMNPFDDSGDYIILSDSPRHSVVRGAALRYINKFVSEL